jgi:hypothetical protein
MQEKPRIWNKLLIGKILFYLNHKNEKINLSRITTHDNEIASGTAVSSEPTLNLSSSGTAATTTEAQAEVNSLKCDE